MTDGHNATAASIVADCERRAADAEARVHKLTVLLLEAQDVLEEYADVRDGSDRPMANSAMSMAEEIRRELNMTAIEETDRRNRRVTQGIARELVGKWNRNDDEDRVSVARDIAEAGDCALAVEVGNLLTDADRSTLVMLMLRGAR